MHEGCRETFGKRKLEPQASVFLRFPKVESRGETWGGYGGGVTPPKKTKHVDWQGESSGLAGQSKILNDRM